MSETIVVLDPLTEATAVKLRGLLPPGFVLTHGSARDEAHLQAIIADADYAITGQIGVSGAVLAAGKRLKLLHKWGVGVDNIDLDAARRLGVTVARTTGSNAVPVAELTIALMIAALRDFPRAAAELDQGRWVGGNYARPSFLLSGKTVGIVGFGAIGQMVARLLTGFGCTLLYTAPRPKDTTTGARHVPLPELLALSDVVSLHCPLTPETAGIIDRIALSAMKPSAVLVNVARGGVVVEPDLVWALQNQVIHAAAMDVFEIEPLPADSPLIGLPGLTITPHMAASSAETFDSAVKQMFSNIQAVAAGDAVPARDLVVG